MQVLLHRLAQLVVVVLGQLYFGVRVCLLVYLFLAPQVVVNVAVIDVGPIVSNLRYFIADSHCIKLENYTICWDCKSLNKSGRLQICPRRFLGR